MPYGYEKYRIDNKISPKTYVHEVRLIRRFLEFVNLKYKKNVEPYEIRPVDIKEFLDRERASGNQDSTVNRKLSYIRQWYDYMWQINKIYNDFMPKLKYSTKLELKPSEININYAALLRQKDAFLKEPGITLIAKQFFIFYMRGIRVRDITLIEVDHFNDNGNTLNLNIVNQSGIPLELCFDNPTEIGVLLTAIERATFRDVPYIFNSKVEAGYGAFQLGSFNYYLGTLAEYFGVPIRSEEVRYAYVHYLYTAEKKTIEEIQVILGITFDTTTRILKESLERIAIIDYNKKVLL